MELGHTCCTFSCWISVLERTGRLMGRQQEKAGDKSSIFDWFGFLLTLWGGFSTLRTNNEELIIAQPSSLCSWLSPLAHLSPLVSPCQTGGGVTWYGGSFLSSGVEITVNNLLFTGKTRDTRRKGFHHIKKSLKAAVIVRIFISAFWIHIFVLIGESVSECDCRIGQDWLGAFRITQCVGMVWVT